MRTRRPWYGFLYYLLGAQGSFFVWVACVLGLYLTRKEAVLYVFNRAPARTTVREITGGDLGLRRWVELNGTELDLAAIHAATAADRVAQTPRVKSETILIDPETGAASAWRNLLDALDRLAATPIDDPERITTRLWKLVHEPSRSPERYRPERGLVVVPGNVTPSANATERGAEKQTLRTPSGGGPQPVAATASAAATTSSAFPKPYHAAATEAPERAGVLAFQTWLTRLHERLLTHVSEPGYSALLARSLLRKFASTSRRALALRSAVRPAVRRRGLLHRLPRSRIAYYRERHGVEVAPFALVTGQSPHYLAALIFGVFATLLLFLVVGLFALRNPPIDLNPNKPEATPTD